MEWSLATLKEATGAAEHLAKYLFSQAVCGSGATLGLAEDQVYKLGAISEQLIAIAPQDPVEGMLAAQMVAVHNLAMNAFAKAARIIEQGPASAQRSQDPGIADRQLSRGLKLIAAFHRGLECLDRRRGKGQQRIIVEHIDQAAILVQGDLERK